MQLHELKRKIPNRRKKRVGRGGKRGKTSGRGHKGQKSRAGRKIRPQIRDVIKRIPKRRGFGKNRSRAVNPSKVKAQVVNVGVLNNVFSDGESVTPKTLIEKKLVKSRGGKMPEIKVLSHGDLERKLSFSGFAFSEKAKEKIKKAGGSVNE